jgi:uncharacterized protein
MEQDKRSWRTLNGRRITQTIEQELQEVITKELLKGYDVKVCVGTDSQVKQSHTSFASVIVVMRMGAGAFMFIHQFSNNTKMSIKERMMQEVSSSVTIAYEIAETLQNLNVAMEVHADINISEKYKSNTALQDASGYIRGMGFEFKAKPQAFASSSCANKIVQ